MSNCRVAVNDEICFSEDFVAVLAHADGGATIFFDTDALTMGIAFKLIAVEFVKQFAECSPEQKEEIVDILGLSTMDTIQEVYDGQDTN